MSIQRDLWTGQFTFTGSLPWLCPSCGVAKLRVKTGSLSEGETRASKAEHNHAAWEPEWIDGRFSCLLECSHCEGESGVTGNYTVSDERGYAVGEEVGGYVTYYKPKYFMDAPQLIDVPSTMPNGAQIELERSFGLYWADPLACANRIRTVVEEILTAQRVNKSTGGPRSGKPRRLLSLHKRIELFGSKRPELADKLMAIKWIGNAGSHLDAVEQEDLLDAYDMLSFVLDELYVGTNRKIVALARAINRRGVPRSKRRSSHH